MNEKIKNSFIHPSEEFSPIPFWFWNDTLSKNKILRQIQDFYEKGVNGFVLHPRMGLPKEPEYLSEKFMAFVKCAVKEAHRLGMRVILYDEGMYPSGSAHGMVVAENAEYASRGLRIEESSNSEPVLFDYEELVCSLTAKKCGDTIEQGSVKRFSGGRLPEKHIFLHLICGFTGGHIRGIHIGEDDWENPPKSADLLNPNATACFLRLTHEKYYKALKEYFGNTVIAMFTDEPCIMGRDGDARMVAWTNGFLEKAESRGITAEQLPALWYDIGEQTDKIRRSFAKLLEYELTENYYRPISDWCVSHGIALAGHPAESEDIGLLRCFQIPGQDLIFRRVAPEEHKGVCGAETTQAKCTSDFARHRGLRRNLNECFACCGKNSIDWSYTADDMKWMIDWLTLRGVNLLVPHAFFYSVRGGRRFGERPPDVGPNNIWWKYYGWISSYMKRMCAMMTDSFNTASVAILCESDSLPHKSARWLYENQIEFNYLEESLLESGAVTVSNGMLHIKRQHYSTLIIEKEYLVSDKVRTFAESGGQVIVCPQKAADAVEFIAKDAIITPQSPDLRVSHLVKDGEHFYVLVNEGEQEISGILSIYASDEIYILDAWKGTIEPYNGISMRLRRRESLILAVGANPEKRTEICFGISAKTEREIKLEHWSVAGRDAALGSWTEKEETRDFCGTMTYETEFEWSNDKEECVIMDLGEVHEQAEVTVNGETAGFRLWAPYEFDITLLLQNGKNSIKVSVSNTQANRYTKHRLPSGLFGEVVLKCSKTICSLHG